MATKYFCDVCGSEIKSGHTKTVRLKLPGEARIDASISLYESPSYSEISGLRGNPVVLLCDSCLKQGLRESDWYQVTL